MLEHPKSEWERMNRLFDFIDEERANRSLINQIFRSYQMGVDDECILNS